MKPLLVGEDNPYGGDPRLALYPTPPNAAGGRLARILCLTPLQYLRRFDRRNLCSERWSAPEARAVALATVDEYTGSGVPVVLLGAKVARAFGVNSLPFACWGAELSPLPGLTVAVLPHPSGRNRIWNQPGAAARARDTLRAAGVEFPAGVDLGDAERGAKNVEARQG